MLLLKGINSYGEEVNEKMKIVNKKGQIKNLSEKDYKIKMAMSQAYISALGRKKGTKLALKLFD